MRFEECSTSSRVAKMGAVTCTHKRSKSFPHKIGLNEYNSNHYLQPSDRVKLDMRHIKRNRLANAEIQNSLRNEIFRLEKRLQDQVCVCGALEHELGCTSFSHDITNQASIPKSATELIKEIAVLEYEVSHLEQYLLSLYRKAFHQQISCPSSSRNAEIFDPIITHLESGRFNVSSKQETPVKNPSLDDLQVNSWKDSNRSLEENEKLFPSSIVSLAEHLGTRISDHVPETPNKVSEDIIKCMSAIFCKLSEKNHGFLSPMSSISSISDFSPKDPSDMMWGPGFRRDSSSFDVRLENPFGVQGLKEFSGPYTTMIEVQFLFRENQKSADIEPMLQHFRSLVSQLEEVDPRKLKREEKLAFWINVHNALVMHAILAYGIPQNNMKRVFLLLKAAYNVGGHVISADVIQSCILGCRISRPGQWLRMLLSSRTKFRVGEEREAYAIDHPEPLLHFALSSGCHSDPAVRVYTPKRILQEQEVAKEEFIRATFGVGKHHKIVLPKIVESFAKDSGLCAAAVMEMVHDCLPESVSTSMKKRQVATSCKNIIWVPHNFGFRYLIPKELVT